ncbi:MAG TPA: glycosyltransferase family 4 protein [Stellaceae bacterium]|jgi:glycosyltransferase involved in cell wall biosynthesis
MRIAWVTPWHDRSSIAADSKLIAEAMAARGIEMAILRAEIGDAANLPARPTDLPIYPAGFATREWLRDEFDTVIYSLGDHYLYHGDAIRLMRVHPGITVIHDVWVAGVVRGWAVSSGAPSFPATAATLLYGAPPPAAAPIEWLFANQPMTEWAASLSVGAVVHSMHYEPRVRAACSGPVSVLRIPAERHDLGIPAPRRRGPNDPVVIATLGNIHPYKIVSEIIQAIGASPRLRALCQYRLIGSADEPLRSELLELAGRLGVALDISGFLSDADFAAAIAETDVVCCLRRPIMEGTSGSMLTALLASRPTLVCDGGAYAEVPDKLVAKIPPEAPGDAITAGLERLVFAPDAAREMGARARQWVLDSYSLEDYVSGLIALAQQVISRAPLADVARYVTTQARLLGLSPSDPALARIAAEADCLFADSDANGWVETHTPHLR